MLANGAEGTEGLKTGRNLASAHRDSLKTTGAYAVVDSIAACSHPSVSSAHIFSAFISLREDTQNRSLHAKDLQTADRESNGWDWIPPPSLRTSGEQFPRNH